MNSVWYLSVTNVWSVPLLSATCQFEYRFNVIKHGDGAIVQEIWAKRSLEKTPSKDSMIKQDQPMPDVVESFDVLIRASEKSLITQYQQSQDIVKSFDQTLIILIAKRELLGSTRKENCSKTPGCCTSLSNYLKGNAFQQQADDYFRTMLAEQLSTEELFMIDQKRLSKGKGEYVVLTLDDSSDKLFLMANNAVFHNCNVQYRSVSKFNWIWLIFSCTDVSKELYHESHCAAHIVNSSTGRRYWSQCGRFVCLKTF